MYPASLNLDARSAPCATDAANTIVLRGRPYISWVFLIHSFTTSPVILMPRSVVSASDHSPAIFLAPVMSISLARKTRKGTSIFESTRCLVVTVLTTCEKILPKPLVNGVADRPITLMLGCMSMNFFVALRVWCASSMIRRSRPGKLLRFSNVCAEHT